MIIRPGTGLRRPRAAGGHFGIDDEEVVVFERTEAGSGGLVLNRPTPVLLGDISSDRFRPFGSLPLMMGCGIDGGGDSDAAGGEDGGSVALGDLSPWFW